MDEREGECSGAELDELAGQFHRMHFSAAAAAAGEEFNLCVAFARSSKLT